MTKDLDFFFFIGSTYTYLTINRIEALAAKEAVNIRWRPFNARALMIEQNNRPFVGKPIKLQYMWRDLERRAHQYGISFLSKPPYPVDLNDQAGRVAGIAAQQGWCAEFTKAIYQYWFLEASDPGDSNLLSKVLNKLGKDSEEILKMANSDKGEALYQSETDTARELGLFGSPSFVVSGEVFWGDDRLEDAISWLKNNT